MSDQGAILATFTPSISEDAQSLCDVKLLADGNTFVVIDEVAGRLFKFAFSGQELATWQPYGLPGTLVQMVAYVPNGTATPPAAGDCARQEMACWGQSTPSIQCIDNPRDRPRWSGAPDTSRLNVEVSTRSTSSWIRPGTVRLSEQQPVSDWSPGL